MLNLTKQQVKALKKHMKTKGNNNNISAKDFNNLIMNISDTSFNNKGFTKEKTINKKSKYDYEFTFHVEKINEDTYKISLMGKHLSTNKFNSILSLGRRKAYKDAIKKAAYHYSLIHRKKYKEILPAKPFENAIIEPTAYNPVSRDDDGCDQTLKILRDLLTTYKFIEDDKRKNLKQLPTEEVVTKEYKIEVLLKKVA